MTVVSEPLQKPAAASQRTMPKSRGAPTAFDLARLVRDHQATVWRYLRFLGAGIAEAEDLTQETFLALARSSFVEEDERQTSGYLRTVARRQLLMLRRKQRCRITTVEIEAADAVWSEAFEARSGHWDDQTEAARRCVEKLEGRARQAVDLCYRDSKSRDAIAEQLGMTADGVKTLLRRTRTKLRECIEKTLTPSS